MPSDEALKEIRQALASRMTDASKERALAEIIDRHMLRRAESAEFQRDAATLLLKSAQTREELTDAALTDLAALLVEAAEMIHRLLDNRGRGWNDDEHDLVARLRKAAEEIK